MTHPIRPYAAGDRDAVLAMLTGIQEHERALHDTRVPGGASTEAYLNELLADLAAKSGGMFVAEGAGKPVGVVAGYIVDDPSVNETEDSNLYAYCSDIYVAPEQRGSGLAQD